jgi:hypothetical protein
LSTRFRDGRGSAKRKTRFAGRNGLRKNELGAAICQGALLRKPGKINGADCWISSPTLRPSRRTRYRWPMEYQYSFMHMFPSHGLRFPHHLQESTIGASFFTKTIPDKHIKFEIW